jgi:hypothetical protein
MPGGHLKSYLVITWKLFILRVVENHCSNHCYVNTISLWLSGKWYHVMMCFIYVCSLMLHDYISLQVKVQPKKTVKPVKQESSMIAAMSPLTR